MLDFMFSETPCTEITSLIPDGNERAKRFAEVSGFHETFRRESFIPLNGEIVGATFVNFTYDQWALRSAAAKREGEAFHELIHEVDPAPHPDDPVHNAVVRATILALKAGNAVKGVHRYNKWALTAGYMLAKIETIQPIRVNIGTCIVEIRHGEIQLL